MFLACSFMGLFPAVSRGSPSEPKVLVARHNEHHPTRPETVRNHDAEISVLFLRGRLPRLRNQHISKHTMAASAVLLELRVGATPPTAGWQADVMRAGADRRRLP
ncbi:hypothetical protein QR685DRAFT_449283 [Neurospora intermedia]|uniref:Secreted protein n=1 Tax=Neurospora intermedia TaxID=5142 RepID=A0ABR3D332_NEUIN